MTPVHQLKKVGEVRNDLFDVGLRLNHQLSPARLIQLSQTDHETSHGSWSPQVDSYSSRTHRGKIVLVTVNFGQQSMEPLATLGKQSWYFLDAQEINWVTQFSYRQYGPYASTNFLQMDKINGNRELEQNSFVYSTVFRNKSSTTIVGV
jgi:hypothetical protein